MTINHPNFGKIADNQIIIFDTTLRDGEQAPGFSMTADEKIRMATALAALGIDVMEAGFPAASPNDFESVRLISGAITGPVIAGLSRAAPGDIERCAEALKTAKRRRIHTFIATSELHMAAKLRMTAMAKPGIGHAEFELLSLADRHSAKSLKTACIENLFVYGQHIFKDAALETLDPRLLIELLRDFADRRAVHMPSPPAPPPPPETEAEEEDDDDPVQEPYQMVGGKRMRKRKGSA